MSSNVLVLQLVLLGVILESDLGLKKIGWFRIARPVIAIAAIVPSYMTSLPTSGNDVGLQILGVVVGAAIGLASVTPLFVAVGYDRDYRGRLARLRDRPGAPATVSRAGVGYALIWIVVVALRLAFAYGSTHTFPHGLGHFLVTNQLTAVGLTNALIFFSVGMDLFRSVGLVVRASRVHHDVAERTVATPAGGPSPLTEHAATSAGGHAGGIHREDIARFGAAARDAVVDAIVEQGQERDQRRANRRRRR